MANIRGYSPRESKYDILPVIFEGKIVVQCQDGHKSVVECSDRFIITESCRVIRRVNRTKITCED